MQNLYLSRSEWRTLRKMRGRDAVPETEIPNCKYLYKSGLIVPNLTYRQDGFNAMVRDGTYKLSDEYFRYAEYRREQLLHWLVPVVISAAALAVSFVALFK